MDHIAFFDCSCSIGMRKIIYPGSFYEARDLVVRMERYGIKRALVYHSMAREYNPLMGNELLFDEIKEYPNLYPVWIVAPHHTREFPHPNDLIEQMRERDVRIVRMFPALYEQNYSIAEWNCGRLFSLLEQYQIPLIIGKDQIGLNQLYQLCYSHPELKIILADVDYRIDRNIYPLFEKFKHLYIETFGYKVHDGLEEICKIFGAERLIFGSGMPLYSGGAAVSMINYARISEEDKMQIAYKNLESLLGGVKL